MSGARELTKRPNLEDQLFDNRGEDEDKLDDKRLVSTLQLIYAAGKVQIYKIADKIASCELSKDEPLCSERKVKIPTQEEWNFRLGDRVRVKYSYSDFRTIQIQAVGWNKRLHGVHEYGGIVTRVKSKFSNTVQVYTPEHFCTSSLYAGVLEKVPREESAKIASQWKMGDFVKTKADKKVAKLLQSRLDPLPDDLLGKKGRVIAVTNVCIIVTFDERTSYDVNSYLLLRCDDEEPLAAREPVHPKGFRIGEKVWVTSNLKTLVRNQDKIGWNPNMTILCGQQVTITGIRNDGNINVQLQNKRAWRINPSSLAKIDDVSNDDDVLFKPRDKVKIKIPHNMRQLLASAGIPLVFLEYIRSVANVKLLDKDLDCLLQFNADQKVSAFSSTLAKATEREVIEYNKIQQRVRDLKVGDAVDLDIGPVNFVRHVLAEVQTKRDIMKALTTSATLVGYTEENRAVIEYPNGRRYRIRKEFLTVPEKFTASERQSGIDVETIHEIQQTVLQCIQEIDCNAETIPTVKLISVRSGSPPYIDFNVFSENEDCGKVAKRLRTNFSWDIKEVCPDRQYIIDGLKSRNEEVMLGLVFNDGDYEIDGGRSEINDSQHIERTVSYGAECRPKLEANPPPAYREVEPEFRLDNDCSWMPLRDHRLGQTVYFPYKIRRGARHFLDLDGPVENTARATIINSERNVINKN